MHIETYRYRNGDWDGSFDLTSDGPNTLLLAFGDSTQLDDAEVIAELAAAFPTSVLMGCSTAGEILDARVEDNSLTSSTSTGGHPELRSYTKQTSTSP